MPTSLSAYLQPSDRTAKPRSHGLTMIIDTASQSATEFNALVQDYNDSIDLVKFSFGSAAVTPLPILNRKTDQLRQQGIPYFFGGTFTELHILQRKFGEYLKLCQEYGCTLIEISNGTVPIDNAEKTRYITEAASSGLRVVSEVGYKDPKRSKALSARDWIEAIRADFAAGAEYVITEARESGTSGLADTEGHLRIAVLKDILESDLPLDRIIFEAPTKELQTGFIERLGSNVNLGNVALDDVIALESLRQGLRADTMLHFYKSE
jgi:phosphosulfolactate synthase